MERKATMISSWAAYIVAICWTVVMLYLCGADS